MLRQVGVEPPKWHDVGGLLLEQHTRFEERVALRIPRLAEASEWLRGERELSFYGDVDFIPTEQYTREDGLRAPWARLDLHSKPRDGSLRRDVPKAARSNSQMHAKMYRIIFRICRCNSAPCFLFGPARFSFVIRAWLATELNIIAS